MHESGTGGEPKYGVVAQMPLVGNLDAQRINIANNQTYQVRHGYSPNRHFSLDFVDRQIF
jgi:hypothetical protein